MNAGLAATIGAGLTLISGAVGLSEAGAVRRLTTGDPYKLAWTAARNNPRPQLKRGFRLKKSTPPADNLCEMDRRPPRGPPAHDKGV